MCKFICSTLIHISPVLRTNNFSAESLRNIAHDQFRIVFYVHTFKNLLIGINFHILSSIWQYLQGKLTVLSVPFFILLRAPLPLPGLLHEPVVLLDNAFAPVRLMLQHGPGFRVLSRDLFRQCLHLGHKLVDERHHLVHGLLEGIFIFRVFIGTGNKRPQRLRRGHGVIQRVRRQFLQGFLPAQLLAFGGLVLLLLLRHSGLQVVSFRAPQ